MADDDSGDKTEPATPRRREEAREQGQVARSPDLTAAVLLLATLLLLNATGTQIVGALKTLVGKMLAGPALSDFNPGTLAQNSNEALAQVAISLAPLLVGVVVIAILANIVQIGLVFNPARLAPNFGALNPVQGWSKVFQSGVKPVPFLINIVKLAVLLGVAYSALRDRIVQVVTAQQLSFLQVFLLGAQTIYSIALRIAIALLVIALIEYVYKRWRLEQDLKMTKNEVKEEMRRMEGDPKIKQRRRQIALQRLQQKLKKDVPTADVIVTNPTHYAVALKYDSDTMHSPRVVAKGADFIALRIREIAIEHGIPILERKPLARALYQTVEVGHEIPEEFYATVAEILAYVYELSGKAGRKAAG